MTDYVISHCQSLVSARKTQGGCTALWCVTGVSFVPCGVFYCESMLKTDRQQPWVPLQAQTIAATTQVQNRRTFRPSTGHPCICASESLSMLSDVCVDKMDLPIGHLPPPYKGSVLFMCCRLSSCAGLTDQSCHLWTSCKTGELRLTEKQGPE